MKDFTPELFIGIGGTQAFFTLRETYLHTTYERGQGEFGGSMLNGAFQGTVKHEIRSFHHYNLSQDANDAVEKATRAAEAMGMKLNTNAQRLEEEMREIKRATAEEISERQARIERDRAAYEELARQWRAEQEERISNGIFANGPFSGKKFTEATLSYLNWLMDSVDQFEEGSITKLTALKVIELCSDMKLPKPDPSKIVGEVKQRMEFNVTVVRSYSFIRAGWGYYDRPETIYITTMVTDNGECLVSFTGAFKPEVGTKLKIKATVKKHDEYKGQAQTVIKNVKEV